MLVTNCYSHCNIEWEVDDCDSFHNDRCPECDMEIEPFMSIEHTEEGGKCHYHE